jgi:hypothetical protein
MERWATEDEWVKRRQKFHTTIRSEIEARIAEKLIQTRVKQLEQIDDLVQEVFKEVGAVAPKTQEGLISSLVKLLGAGDMMREKLAKEVVPKHLGGVEQETLPMIPKLTTEEASIAARAILRKRRAEVRARAGLRVPEEKPKDKKPKLRMVKGSDDA